MLRYFKTAFAGGGLGLLLGGMIGYASTGTILGFLAGLEIVAILGVLESSMSLDNSFVAAKILKTMNPTWQNRYLTYGMFIAVFGMRFAFPILIVSIMAHISPVATFNMAIHDPEQYSRILMGAKNQITAFGGSFLMLIGLNYFMNGDKKNHWLKFIEHPMQNMGGMTVKGVKSTPVAVTLLFLIAGMLVVPKSDVVSFMICGISGIVSYILVKEVLPNLIGDPQSKAAQTAIGTAGFGMFLYLEMIDSSFSFDGVIGAFAITTNILFIAIGLGIGALVVRCMTMMIVKSGAIDELVYVENGAFLSILVLSAIMFIGLMYEVPNYITGLIGAFFIALSFWASKKELKNGKDEQDEQDEQDEPASLEA